MKTVAIEDLIVSTILTFCENAAELGCRDKNVDVDMWFRELPYEEQYKVAEKMMEIEERNMKMENNEAKCGSPNCNCNCNCGDNQEDVKEIKMIEMELDLSEDTIQGIIEFALERIKNDKKALINYGVNEMLKEIVDTEGECLSEEVKKESK